MHVMDQRINKMIRPGANYTGPDNRTSVPIKGRNRAPAPPRDAAA